MNAIRCYLPAPSGAVPGSVSWPNKSHSRRVGWRVDPLSKANQRKSLRSLGISDLYWFNQKKVVQQHRPVVFPVPPNAETSSKSPTGPTMGPNATHHSRWPQGNTPLPWLGFSWNWTKPRPKSRSGCSMDSPSFGISQKFFQHHQHQLATDPRSPLKSPSTQWGTWGMLCTTKINVSTKHAQPPLYIALV